MTLALTGKSRRRQASLVLAAFLAVFAALAAGIATRDATTVNADAEPYNAVVSLSDEAGGDTTMRPWEWATAEFTLSLPADVPGDELFIEAEAGPEVQFAGFQRFGLMNDLDCTISILGFSCISDGGADSGLYRISFLVRHRTSACVSGPFSITTFVTHPDDPGSPRAFVSQSLTIDCTLPPLLDPEVKIGVQMFSGNPPGAVPMLLTVTEPAEPTYERFPSFGFPTTFTTTPGSTYVTLEPPGGMVVVDVSCTGLGLIQRTGNQLRLTLETGEAEDCAFLLRAPILQIDACYEGPLAQQATGARWGFRSENFNTDTPVTDNEIIPSHPDYPVPFDFADFLSRSGEEWQWSDRITWDPARDFLLDWDVRYGIGTHLGVSIKAPADATVTAENRCPSETEPIQLSLVICNFAVDETDVDQPARFSYYVDGEFRLQTNDSNGGGDTCFPVHLTVPDLSESILVEQVTPASWEHAPNSPERRVIHYQDNPQASRPGESVEVQFADGKGGGIICYEAGIVSLAPLAPLPGSGLACHVIFENVRAESTGTPTPTTEPDPTATPTVPAEESETPTSTPTQPATPTATATTTAEPTATGGGTNQLPGTATATGTPEDGPTPIPATTEPGSGGDGTASTVQPEETVAGERTPAAGSTPIAPSTGESRELAGAHASVWAVIACFLFAASLGFTTLAFWRRDRSR